MLPKLVISFSLLVISLFITPFSAHAQTAIPSYVPPTSPLYTDLLVNNLFHSFSCLAVGQSVIGQPCLSYLKGVPVLTKVNTTGGALGATTSLIAMLYANPPVRTADYLSSLGEGMGLIKKANAQVIGSGQAVLSPILNLWQVSRNISYVIMIVIFVIIGLMIMFRNKLNPQTVITAQAALPGLVIGLIMITFSYFLAGLISDVAFVGTNVVGYYFAAARNDANNPQNLADDMKKQNVLSLFTPLTGILNQGNVSHALDSIWPSLERPNRQENPLDMDPSRAITAIASIMLMQLLMPFGGMFGGIGQIVAGVVAFVPTVANPTGVAGFALAFIGMVILMYAMIKLLLRLVNNFISIIFLTITAPFQLLAASLPGRQGLATNWILNMLANVLAFPAVLTVLYFVAFLMGPAFIKEYYPNCDPAKQVNQTEKFPCVFKVSQINQTDQNGFISTAHAQGGYDSKITGTATFPLFGGMDIGFLNLLLAFGALVALPSIPDIIGRTVGRMSQVGQMLGQEIGGGIGQGRQYAGQFQSGVGGMAQQAGRMTTAHGTQTLWDPNYTYLDQNGNQVTGGFRQTPTETEGQVARMRRGASNIRANIRSRFGI